MRTLPNADCATMTGLDAAALEQVAVYFQALADPTRLLILNRLRLGEQKVGALAQHCGCTSANISRHLSVLSRQGLVARAGRGGAAPYRIADPSIYALCDLVCGNLARQHDSQARVFARPAEGKTRTAARKSAPRRPSTRT